MQWYPVEKEQLVGMLEKVLPKDMPAMFSGRNSEARCARLPFYTNFLIYRLTNNATLPAFSVDFLSDSHQFLYLDGTSVPIYAVNQSGDLILNENTVLDYMAFHVHYVPGPEGEILLIDSKKKVLPVGALDIDRHREMLYTHRDVKISYDSDAKVYTIRVPMYYGGALVKAVIKIDSLGHLEVADYQMLLKASFEESEMKAK
ncbi:MAG: hypothetical protein EOM26_05940 [Alphaproteobacteria bacterium]|nr:hypothetical protein [Alphaproteobacteria bacterium]